MDKQLLWEEQVYIAARTSTQYAYIEHHISEVLRLDKRPVRISDSNVHHIFRGRRDSVAIFYIEGTDVEGWLHYLNQQLRGGVVALRLKS
jgi:hypothetical protein